MYNECEDPDRIAYISRLVRVVTDRNIIREIRFFVRRPAYK